MYRILSIFLLGSLCLAQAGAQTVPEELRLAIQTGNAEKMSVFFHESLEMTILGNDHVASKHQAQRILESFFDKHPPLAFDISFEGVKEQSKYAIGTLTTEQDTFRVNIFFINKGDERLIYYLTIEKASLYELEP
ncbi:MAG: DUF4783 domain-containing protein [Bacteroidales bacterium]